jgi:soluble cytochrome b562
MNIEDNDLDENLNNEEQEVQDFDIEFPSNEEVVNGSIDDFWDPTVETEEEVENVETQEEQEQQQTETEEQEEQEDEYEVKDLDENLAFEFIKKTRGLDIESIDDLLKPKESKKLSPEVEKFLEFTEKTGNTNYNDFLATQKDWSAEGKDVVIKEFLKIENPTLSEKQIDFLYNKNYAFDEEYDDEDVIMEKSINVERDFQKGVKVLDARKEEFMVRKGLDETIPEEYLQAKTEFEKIKQQESEVDKLIEENRNDFITKTESIFKDSFEGFKVKIGNEELSVKPENIQEAKKTQSDLNNFNNKYFDETTGKLKDPEGFHKALYFGMNADKMAEHFYNLGKAKLAEEEDKLSKNITPDSGKKVPTIGGGKITVRVVN